MLFRGGTKRFPILFVIGFLLIAIYTTLQHQRTGKASSAGAADGRKTLFYRDAYLSAASNSTIAAYLRSLTLHPHLAGTPLSLSTATYVHSHFQSLGLTTHMTNFSALLSYPKTSSLTARFTNGTALPITCAEPGVPQNGVVMPYHAYAHSGSANGPAVFLNYGREQDYRALRALGVEVKGCVGLVRRGSDMSRYEIVTKAAAHGVSGVLMYTESHFKKGVERGTVMNGLGDPLSPGWPGINGGEKLELNDRRVTQKFPGVPSLPVSQAAAEDILGLLEGPELPIEWAQSLTSGGGQVGPGPIMLNLSYEGERKMAAVHNVFAVIKGAEEPDRTVLLGNHRDAWTYGAVDPNSGTAALLDIARRFALLLRLGWNPRRTIVLCSWDAEEFGMIGSTEWVEQNALNLGSKAVAYLNVDCAVQGPGFFVSATPQLDDLIVEVTKKVKDPDTENIYLHESWVASNRPGNLVDRLGRVDSDFAPFLHHAGVPSVDFYFGIDFSVYHTAFDSYDWMVKYGDPSFQRHVTVAGVWGLVALHLADDAILPFNYFSYATELQDYTNTLKPLLDERISSEPLEAAIKEFISAVNETEQQLKKLKMDESHDGATVLRRRALNDRLMLAERGFLDMEGLPQDQWFKHLIYGPVGGDNHIKISFFPGVAYAMSERSVDEKQWARVQHEIWRVARAIQRSASALRGELT